ncbi:MAG: UDP-N-acetylmuramoyl-L-alanine--D-glutamate ligase, partial [Deltaproteobacteria bacterium]
YGKTASAIAKKFGNCKIYDDKFTQEESFASNILLPSSHFKPSDEKCVVSPGIAPGNALVKAAKNVISDYDLFAPNMPFSIWVSGTNGKTTLSQMLFALMQNRGATLGGNIGTPLANLDESAHIWVLETSSFTLHYTKSASPNIYVLLPITPDHIRWHGSFEAYESAKLKPLKTMKEGELALVPKKYASLPSDAFVVGYETSEDLAKFFDLDLRRINFSEPFLLDAALALAVTKALFNETNYETINNFAIDPHKLEEFYDAKGRLWVDDSKATNMDASIQAIKRYQTKRLHLILGGDAKGANLSALLDLVASLDARIYLIGQDANAIFSLCEARSIMANLC